VRIGQINPGQLAPSRRGSRALRAELEGRPLLEWCALPGLEGARRFTLLLAASTELSPADRLSPAHLVVAKLGSLLPTDLGPGSPRPGSSGVERATRRRTVSATDAIVGSTGGLSDDRRCQRQRGKRRSTDSRGDDGAARHQLARGSSSGGAAAIGPGRGSEILAGSLRQAAGFADPGPQCRAWLSCSSS
jgi:hypothetical protein